MKEKNRNYSVRRKILIISMLILIAAIASITTISIFSIKASLDKQMMDDGMKIVKEVSNDFLTKNETMKVLESQMEDKIRIVGRVVVNSPNISNEYLVTIAKAMGVAEINIAKADRKIAYSNIPENIGWEYPKDHSCSSLFEGAQKEIMEQVRKSTIDNNYYKYGAISNSTEGIVQIGIDAAEIEKMKEKFSYQAKVDELGGEKGVVYALVISNDLKAIAHSNKERIGIELTDTGSKTAAVDGKPYSSVFIYEGNGKPEKVYDILVPMQAGEGL